MRKYPSYTHLFRLIEYCFFFRKCDSFFKSPNLQKNIPKNYPELKIWICCLLILAGNLDFKFRIVIWKFFFLEISRFEKYIALSEKRNTFKHRRTMIFNYRKLIFVLNQVEQKSLLDRNRFKIHSLYIDLRNSY